jgi:hypothetical protein
MASARALFVLFVLATSLLCLLAPAATQWKVVQRDFATIAMSNSFVSETQGWIVGGTSGMQPLFLYTDDAGKTLTNYGLEGGNVGAFMTVSMADSNNGVAGALGFLTGVCGAYTNNGLNWTQTHEGKDIICVSQSSSTPDPQTFILVGAWSSKTDLSGDGLQVSLDGGATFNGYDWNQGTSSRYGSFLSKDLGYVTGGQWPETDDSDDEIGAKVHDLNMHLRFDGKTIQRKNRQAVDEFDGYWGLIAQATNGGQNFKTLVNLTNEGLYFNQISCTDENNCWATAEGNDVTSGNVTAWIYATTDGWNTYTTQLTFDQGSLTCINMLSPTFGWAGGMNTENDEGAFFQTTDGKTWTLFQSIKNFYVMDFSVIDQNTAFASGVTSLGLSSFAAFSTSN